MFYHQSWKCRSDLDCIISCVDRNPKDEKKRNHCCGIIDAVLCSGILKNVFRRIRPFDVNTAIQVLITKPRDFSFPSGHTSASFAAATALYLAKERKLFATTLVLACLITFSRMYLYVHYPTDILGGLLLGIASAYLAYWCQKKIPAVRRNSEKLAS